MDSPALWVYSKNNLLISPEEEMDDIENAIAEMNRMDLNNEFEKAAARRLNEKFECVRNPVERYEQFWDAFDAGDDVWVTLLSCLRLVMPKDEQVRFYSQQYDMATNNTIKILKCLLGSSQQ